ncbi:MAG: succinate dehydrogenase, cytochrome b556 subunit [Bacteroidota bacterium]|nr:succinate dehydrogenase, cytochrome b556 subunit [Bacteroidota bacterium]
MNFYQSGWTKVLTTYHRFAGSWAWILHRISGLALTAYIFMHIIALSNLQKHKIDRGKAFNEEMALFSSPFFLVIEWLLFAFVLYHTLNGIRIVLVDFANGARYHKQLHYAVVTIGIIAFLAMGYVIFSHQVNNSVAVLFR